MVQPLIGSGLSRFELINRVYRFFIPFECNRQNEWFVDAPWFLSHLNGYCQLILDTGFITHEFITRRICKMGHKVIGIDIGGWWWSWRSPMFTYLKADLVNPLPLADGKFDIIFSPSLIEHLGLGYYGDGVKDNADFSFICECFRILKPGGVLLLQVPFGKTARLICGGESLSQANDDTPFYRIYTLVGLRDLLDRFRIEEISYARFNENKVWQVTDEAMACQIDWQKMPTQCIVRVKARKPT
jgi:SAM-dependent methyltransferase